MSTCTIYYPGLLGPDVPLQELPAQDWPAPSQLSHLGKLFSHGQLRPLPGQGNKRSLEARILHYLGVIYADGQDVPVAQLRSQHFKHDDEHLWCLDPVHIQIDMDGAILLANEALKLTEQEARHLIEDINQHFKQDDLYIHYCTPHQWMVKGNFKLVTRTLNEVMHRNISEHQPGGKDENRWRIIVNEVQMLLHVHPVNLERAERGEPLVNSLWLWGGGRYNTVQTSIDLVYGDDALSASVASVRDIPHKALPIQLDPEEVQNRTSLLIFTDHLHVIHSRDVFGWLEHLARFDEEILAPLFAMLRLGSLAKLIVHGDTVECTLTRKDLKKWWRRTKPASSYILNMRRTYGY